MVAMTGKGRGSLLRDEIAEFLGKTWSGYDAAGGRTLNNVYAYAMVNALVGVCSRKFSSPQRAGS